MSSVRNPVGPQPPSVYWRRRIFALLGLVAIIVVIVLIVTSLQGGGGTPSPTPSGTASASPQADSGAGGDEDACDPASIVIEPVTDAVNGAYDVGVLPLISMRVTNVGPRACTLDVGTGAQEYLIMSGSDRIWSSRDCQTDPSATLVVLEPGVANVTDPPISWNRTRSSTSTCSSARPEVIAAGATYRLSVRLGEIDSASDTPFILK